MWTMRKSSLVRPCISNVVLFPFRLDSKIVKALSNSIPRLNAPKRGSDGVKNENNGIAKMLGATIIDNNASRRFLQSNDLRKRFAAVIFMPISPQKRGAPE